MLLVQNVIRNIESLEGSARISDTLDFLVNVQYNCLNNMYMYINDWQQYQKYELQ